MLENFDLILPSGSRSSCPNDLTLRPVKTWLLQEKTSRIRGIPPTPILAMRFIWLPYWLSGSWEGSFADASTFVRPDLPHGCKDGRGK